MSYIWTGFFLSKIKKFIFVFKDFLKSSVLYYVQARSKYKKNSYQITDK